MSTQYGNENFMAAPLPVDSSELPWYRERTTALLRRYFRLAVETGRLPSVLGREFFRARVSSQRMHTFEDAVIFVHDMERCLERLDRISKQLIARRALQGHTDEETARLVGCSRRHVVRLYPVALDRLAAILLRVEMLRPGIDAPAWRGAPEEIAEIERGKKSVARVMACQDPQRARMTATA